MSRRLKPELPEPLLRVLREIRGRQGRALLVGGAVRDTVLGLPAKDFDVEVYGMEIQALAETLGTLGTVHQVGRSFGVLKVVVEGDEIDVSLPRRESKAGRGHRGFLVRPDATLSPEQAASRRDFTINAMALDPDSGELLDFFGGLADLKSGTLRHVGPAFADDPLRVLRGMQFAGRFDLTATPETLRLSRSLFEEYSTLAIERVWAEWYKWAAKSTRPSRGLHYLEASGWWEAYPELPALARCPQDPEWHPEGDVWRHTLLVTDRAAEIATRDGLEGDDRAVLLLAALCHDLGKPASTVEQDGKIRSPGHADRVDVYETLLSAVGCPRRLADRVIVLCRHHLAHMSFQGSKRHVRRLARQLGEARESLAMLARLIEADHDARPPLPGGVPENLRAMLDLARELAAVEAAPKPLLQGRHLLELGFAPGPEMGQVLARAYEAQLDGAFDTLEQARAWAREHRPSGSG